MSDEEIVLNGKNMHLNKLKEILPAIEERLRYSFNKKNVLIEAFVHPSFKNECKDIAYDNERLEFLGDSVLNIVVSKFLFSQYPHDSEGSLTKKKAHIVSKTACACFMRKLHLFEFMLLGRGEIIQSGRSEESNQAHLFEAIIGAIYIDGGLEIAENFIIPLISEDLENLINSSEMNWKANLQDICAQNKIAAPIYRLISEEGTPHQKIFESGVFINEKEIGRGKGRSKKIAEQMAAEKAFSSITCGSITLNELKL